VVSTRPPAMPQGLSTWRATQFLILRRRPRAVIAQGQGQLEATGLCLLPILSNRWRLRPWCPKHVRWALRHTTRKRG
jgi:hypothetical protein